MREKIGDGVVEKVRRRAEKIEEKSGEIGEICGGKWIAFMV